MALTIEEFRELLIKDNLAHYARRYSDERCAYVVDVFVEIQEAKDWCKENCTGLYDVYNENYTIFNLKEDAMAFKLRWS